MPDEYIGIDLDEYFDLDIASNGDIGNIQGKEELVKDASGQIVVLLEDTVIAKQPKVNNVIEFEGNVQTQLENDPRIHHVTDITIKRFPDGNVDSRRSSIIVTVVLDSIYGSVAFSV